LTAPLRILQALLLASGFACSLASLASGPPYVGRALDEVLRELSGHGLHLLYSSETVPPTLRVTREPAPGSPVAVLQELLAQHELVARPVGADTYAVVRAGSRESRTPAGSTPRAVAPLEEVVVAASRYSLAADVPDVNTFLTQDEIEGLPRLADDSLKAVHRLPAAASNGLSGLANIRGGAENETLLVFDGLPLYEPFHLQLLQGPTSILDPRNLKGIDVHAGGFTAEFGDRMSAVIDATSVRPEPDFYGEVGLSLANGNALLAQRFADRQGQWLASFRSSITDGTADLVDNAVGEPSYQDAFARVDYTFSPGTNASLEALLARDEANVRATDGTEAAEADYHNAYVWATLRHEFGPAVVGSVIASYTDVSSDRRGSIDYAGLRVGEVDDERHFDVFGLKLDGSYTTERWLTRFGFELRSLAAEYDYDSVLAVSPADPFAGSDSGIETSRLAPEPSGGHYAAYLTSRFRLTDAITAEIGLRWDEQTYSVDGDNQLGPRVNLAWQPVPGTRLRLSWGRFQQFQGINELQVQDGIDYFFPAQWSDHAVIGLEQELGSGATFRIEGYRKDYGSLMPRFESLYDPLSLVPELRWDRVEIIPSSALAEGVELLLTRKGGEHWNGWLNYTWSRVRDRLDGDDELRSWDQSSNLGGGVTWSRGPWLATLAASYHTGWPTTPLSVSGPASAPVVTIGSRNTRRLPAYASVDARISRDFALPQGTLNVFAEVTNALDRGNPCCTEFGIGSGPGGEALLERSYAYWLPLVANAGVLWKF
jgi:hypothetical protein